MKHIGNLTVMPGQELSFPAVSELHGHLILGMGAHLVVPSLQMVHGWITLMEGARLEAAHLGQIEGWLTLLAGSQALAPTLQSVTETLTMDRGELLSHAVLTCGAVHAMAGQLNLSSYRINGNLTIKGTGTNLEAPRLSQIDGSVTLYANTKLNAPKLVYVGGYFDIDETATLRSAL